MDNRAALLRRVKTPGILRAIVAAVIGISAGGCSARPAASDSANGMTVARTDPDPVVVTVAAVETRPVQRRISVVGSLYGFEQITITPKVEGLVKAIHFDVGDRVPPETTLLELDPIDYELAVNEAERALEQELSRLGLSEPPPAGFDIEQLPTVERARLLQENAERHFQREKSLVATNAATQQDYEQAETDLKVAAAAVRQAQLEAQTTLAAVRHRQSMLELERHKLAETHVRSPTAPHIGDDATAPAEFVVAQRLASVGEMVRAFPSTPVFELVVDNVLKLRAMVPERFVSQVQTGMEAEISVEAYPNETFPAKVVRINPTVDPQNRSFEVEAHVPNADHRLRAGGFAKASIISRESDKALTVPLESVTRFAGVNKVFRVRGGAAEEVLVELGARGQGWVEVTGALEPDDKVVTSGQSRLANGTNVVVRESSPQTAQRQTTASN